jgi:hypothetical protein
MTKISIHYKILVKIVIKSQNAREIIKKKLSGQFSDFRADGEKATSRADLKILQLDLWLEPGRLGLITSIYQ